MSLQRCIFLTAVLFLLSGPLVPEPVLAAEEIHLTEHTLAIDAAVAVGERALITASRTPGRTARLRVLERALASLRPARAAVERTDPRHASRRRHAVERTLARVLNATTVLLLDRGSLPAARRLNVEARQLAYVSCKAYLLFLRIHEQDVADVYEDLGIRAIKRLRIRRAHSRVALRDRGRARRR